ncbi:MAG: ATP-binding protein [Acidobacteriaceae bacterium]|jgi:two-component system sensor histidine kinase KdpD
MVEAVRWLAIVNGLAGIVALYHHFFRVVNPTTVALTLLLLVLVVAANWGLRYGIVGSILATAAFNYFFLPPLDTFFIADTQNWVALFAFLGTAIFASHLSSRIREETEEANARRRESEMLYRLGRQLLQPESVADLLNFIPSSVASAFNSPAVTLFFADKDRIYLSDPLRVSSPHVAWKPDSASMVRGGPSREPERSRGDIVRDLREAMQLPAYRPPVDGFPSAIPLHTGVRPSGALLIEATSLSRETAEALSGLISMSIERAEALENSARSEAAQETERLRTALLDSVTHELRTPLTSIRASVTALISQHELSAEQRTDMLAVIDEESDRLNHLIEQAVEMAQLDAHKVHLEVKPQPVAALVHTAVDECRQSHPSREIRIALASTLPQVLADAEWIHKVLANLLENAVKYSPAGQPIFVSADRQGTMVAISVADRGAGIEPLEQEMIFDKFYRGQGQRERISGTGMGLAICRAIVDAHGGTISVTSQLGHGSVFTFTLPSVRS